MNLSAELFVYTIVALIFGAFTSLVASEKNYNGATWFFLGILFSIIALIAAAGLPLKQPKQDK